MNYYKIKFVFCLTFLTLTGCARLSGVDPSSLKKTKKTNYVVIKSDFKWEEKFSFAQLTHYITLKSGLYKAYLDDGSKGTYYEGEGACLEWKSVGNAAGSVPTINNYRCGVFMPKNEKNRAIVYYYIDPEASKKLMNQTNPGVLIKALDKAEWDNLHHLMYQPDALDLKSHLEISN